MTSEAKRRAIKKWGDEHLRGIGLRLNKTRDADILEWLDKQPSKQGYIKRLIREDMRRSY